MKESAVIREVKNCLAHHQFMVIEPNTAGYGTCLKGVIWRNNSGALFANGHLVHYGIAGSPDLIGLTKEGRFIGIEVKKPKGTLSKVQEWFHCLIKDRGGIVFVARSYEECDFELKKRGL